MNKGIIIFLIVVTLMVFVAVFLVIMSLLVIKPPPTPPKQEQVNTTSSTTKPVSPLVINEKWAEHIRSNVPVNGFPPCFEDNSACKSIYGILASYNLLQKYFTLLDILSVMNCQYMNNKGIACNRTYLKDRTVMFTGMGGNPDNEHAITLVTAYTKAENLERPITKFVIAGVDLIEKEMRKIHDDTEISLQDKSRLQGFIADFYKSNIPDVIQQCRD